MAPKFSWEDFDLARREDLLASHPAFAEEIRRHTRGA
jgi:predicted cupin superfamily sugar epimerase